MLGALPQFLLYRFFNFLACKYTIALAMVCPSIIPHHLSVTTCLQTRACGCYSASGFPQEYSSEQDMDFNSIATAETMEKTVLEPC